MGGVEGLLDFEKVDYGTFNYMIMDGEMIMEEEGEREGFFVGEADGFWNIWSIKWAC